MDNYDAFSEGVEPGGLRSNAQIKYLIGFLLISLKAPLTKAQLFELVQDNAIANYFNTSQALSEMVSSGNVSIEYGEDADLLFITPKGRVDVNALESYLPKSIREKALNGAIRLQTLARRERENLVDVEALENGFNVTFSLVDRGDCLMRLSIFVTDEKQLETVKGNFYEDPAGLYSSIIASLTL